MRALKALVALILLLIVAGGVLWITAPRETWPTAVAAPEPGADLDAWLAARESVFDDLTPGTEKTVVWAGEPGQRTPVALVYLHGFSATRQEINPVAERIAQGIGANLFETRLAGHGRPGAALGAVTLADFATDLAEAMAVARRLGDQVVLVGTSTGGSLATIAAFDPAWRDQIAGLILLSPNYGVRDSRADFLDLPYARWWLPMALGETYGWQPRNAEHARYWTSSYPTTALFAMRGLQTTAAAQNFAAATVPALVFYATGDQVVDSARTEAMLAAWGAPVEAHVVTGAEDPAQHVITGRILSPSTVDGIVATSLDWLRAQGLAPNP